MGGRYGGHINRRGPGTAWSTRKALEAVGEETRRAFGWKPGKDPPQAKKGGGVPA